MANINIKKAHPFTLEQCREIMEEMGGDIANKFKGSYSFKGNDLVFKAPGINGEINLTDGEVEFNAKLGLLMRPMKSIIEKQVHDGLDEIIHKNKPKNKIKI